MNLQRQFVCLAKITDNRIQLENQALQILEHFDFLSIITLEGNLNKMPPLINSFDSSVINNYDDCVWMSKYPLFSSRLKRYIVVLKIFSDEDRRRQIGHAFCSLISNIVIVCNYQNLGLSYLSEVPKYIRNQQGDIKNKMCGIVGLTQNGMDSVPGENVQLFGRALQAQNIQRLQISNLYSYISGYQIPPSFNLDNISHIQSYLQDIIEQGIGNPIIMYGQVVKEYASNLSKQFNNQGGMNPFLAQQLIQVDEYFQDYIQAVEVYNNKCKNTLGNEAHADIGSKLRAIRTQTQRSPLYQQSEYYSTKMGIHMDRKELQLTRLNQQLNDTYNINLLQKQSAKALQVVTNNQNITHQDVSKQIEKLTARYNERARGSNKDKLLTQFLQVFTPTIYSEAGVSGQTEKRINKLLNTNKKLQDEIKQFDKKKSKGCCQIM